MQVFIYPTKMRYHVCDIKNASDILSGFIRKEMSKLAETKVLLLKKNSKSTYGPWTGK